MANYVTEKQVKEVLGIDSFRNLSKDKIMSFASMIPNMDKDVALGIIKQFPEFAESSSNIIEQFKNMCDSALESNKECQKETIIAYRKVLDDLGELVKREDITPEERENITNKMLEVADKMADMQAENKRFLNGVIKYGASLTAGALVLGAAILGVNIKGGINNFKK